MSRTRVPGIEPRWQDQGPARGHISGTHGYGAVSGWWLTAESLEDRARVERERIEKARREAK